MANRSFRLSRRTLIAGALASPLANTTAISAQPDFPKPSVSLGHGLEIRDYRLFPTPDVMRFIVEVYNSTEEVIDTPTIGVILPHLPSGEDFGIAMPAITLPVIHPQSSVVLFGVAPKGIVNEEYWGMPDWFLCSEVSRELFSEVATLNIEWGFETNYINDEKITVIAHLTNNEAHNIGPLMIAGFVKDQNGRPCGLTLAWKIGNFGSEASQEVNIHIDQGQGYFASPFVLIDSLADVQIQMTLQPKYQYRHHQCPVVMPWNR